MNVTSTANRLKATVKTATILSLMGGFAAQSYCYEFLEPRQWRLRKKRIQLVQRYAKVALDILGIEVHSEKATAAKRPQSKLLVGNHLSWLDVVILAAESPACFVTSQEIRETPFLGKLTELGGCLFVERRSREGLGNEIDELREALRRGLDVTIFPEATSTNGESVLRFRRPLFRAAVDAKRAVKPFCINYRKIDDVPITSENRDTVCWYGSMDFLPHLWNLSQKKRIAVDLHWLNDLHFAENSNETDLSSRAHQAVTEVFSPLSTGPHLPPLERENQSEINAGA